MKGWEYLKHFALRRERSQWSLVFGLDVLICRTFSTSYVVYFYGEEYPICVAVWGQIRGVKGYEEYLDACLDGLGNLDATFHHVVVNNIRL